MQASNNAYPVLLHLTTQSSNTELERYIITARTNNALTTHVPKTFCGVLFYFNLQEFNKENFKLYKNPPIHITINEYRHTYRMAHEMS